MIKDRLKMHLAIEYEKRILIFDEDFDTIFDYKQILSINHFSIAVYEDVELFRYKFETEIRNSNLNWAIIVTKDIYIPFDIMNTFYSIRLSLKELFPKLNANVLRKYKNDLDLISMSYETCYSDLATPEGTEGFIQENCLSYGNIRKYCDEKIDELTEITSQGNRTPDEWSQIALIKAKILYYASIKNLHFDLSFVDNAFKLFVKNEYKNLSTQVRTSAPAILPKTLEFISGGKVALIVMDGMSIFDFEILSHYFNNIKYELNGTFAMIPTTTAISRQCLLSGKYPRELENPFNLSREEKQFHEAAQNLGYSPKQILYTRGYAVNVSYQTKFVAIIINEIDDMVHGQMQGRPGMYNDITLFAKSSKLQDLIRDLATKGFEVYITSDHGNRVCTGVGTLRNTGVEVETKSKRMVILKDFAEENELIAKYASTYEGYYLDKSYKYFICEPDVSYDVTNEEVVTHGGSTIDEVIVPFIKIKAVI
jgi:hypothetical protein